MVCYAAYARLKQEIREEEAIFEAGRQERLRRAEEKKRRAEARGPAGRASARLAADGARRAAERNAARAQERAKTAGPGPASPRSRGAGLAPRWIWGSDGRRRPNPDFDPEAYYSACGGGERAISRGRSHAPPAPSPKERAQRFEDVMEDFDEYIAVAGTEQFEALVRSHYGADGRGPRSGSGPSGDPPGGRGGDRGPSGEEDARGSGTEATGGRPAQRDAQHAKRSRDSAYRRHLVPMLMQGGEITRERFDEMREYYPEIQSLAREKARAEEGWESAESGGAESGGAESGGAESGGAESGGAESGGRAEAAASPSGSTSTSPKHGRAQGRSESDAEEFDGGLASSGRALLKQMFEEDDDERSAKIAKDCPLRGPPCAQSGCEGFEPNEFLPNRCRRCAYDRSQHRAPSPGVCAGDGGGDGSSEDPPEKDEESAAASARRAMQEKQAKLQQRLDDIFAVKF
jgi:hypothetical protein